MTYFVYILESLKDGTYYVGSTNHLSDRVERHNQGRSKYTKNRGPWVVVDKNQIFTTNKISDYNLSSDVY